MCLPSGKCNCAVYLKEGIFLEQPLGTGKYSHRFRKKKKKRERGRVTVKSPERSSLANRSANCLQCSSEVTIVICVSEMVHYK